MAFQVEATPGRLRCICASQGTGVAIPRKFIPSRNRVAALCQSPVASVPKDLAKADSPITSKLQNLNQSVALTTPPSKFRRAFASCVARLTILRSSLQIAVNLLVGSFEKNDMRSVNLWS